MLPGEHFHLIDAVYATEKIFLELQADGLILIQDGGRETILLVVH